MKKTFVTKEQVEAIAAQYPTPFHLYDEKGIRENVKALKDAFVHKELLDGHRQGGLQRAQCSVDLHLRGGQVGDTEGPLTQDFLDCIGIGCTFELCAPYHTGCLHGV